MARTTGKGGASKTKTYNKAKSNRKTFKSSQKKYKSDFQSMVCATYLSGADIVTFNNSEGEGSLSNIQAIVAPGVGAAVTQGNVVATIALHASNNKLACPTHAAYKGLFNEWRTSAIYIDLLLNKPLRECCENVFLLVERGNKTSITSVGQMCSDVNHKMYKCNNNIQTIKFKHIFSDVVDKIFKKSNGTDDGIVENDTIYLKILAPISNYSDSVDIGANDCQISMRVKMFNQYKDMKVLTGANIPLN